ncbi:MAG: FAD-dependent oxidoreductase [Bryobacterales bacterium]|nr:FAD-dependent oxidoreductase [Bryobacterales bacterium]
MHSTPDVLVIGGGPAGSTVSTLLAQQGVSVALYERDHFPRFHIGESLIPETYWVLERLGMLDELKKSPFTHKHSVQFISANGRVSAPFYFWDNKPHECSQTWQVVRSEFDLMLLNNARRHGVQVHEGTHVTDVLFNDTDTATGIRIRNQDGTTSDIPAKVVVDASGQSGLLQHKRKLRVWDPELNKGAIWTYWKGAFRDTGRNAGATMVIQTPDRKGWFWYIPLHDDRVSVGIVRDFDSLFPAGNKDHEAIYQREVDNCPGLQQRLNGATRITGYFATRDYSYRSTQVSGNGWVLIGDAFAFLDPLYSSGVLLALKSGQLAADAIADGLRKNDLSAAQLGHWGPAFTRGIDRMRRLVCEFYDGFSFGKLMRANPELRGTVTDLLIGDLFTDRVDSVWPPLEALYPEGKQRPQSWFAGTPMDNATHKQNELVLPEGRRP